jgi:two-component system sensor histidine kinase PhoQ
LKRLPSLRLPSLRIRLFLGVFLVLAVFLGTAGLGQERAFRAAVLTAERDKLSGLIFALLGATEQSARGALIIADFDLPDPRLTQPDSGLAAWLLTADGLVVWRSPSALHAPPQHTRAEIGEFEFGDDGNAFIVSYGLRWLGLDAEAQRYSLLVEASRAPFLEQLRAYRAQLLIWIAAAAAGLLLVMTTVLTWLLAPIRRLERQLAAVERGDASEINGDFPEELLPLTTALNAMLRSEHSQQARYRNALGDLAHTLKTPLAVLSGMIREGESNAARLQEQVDRMREITDHQLRRASHTGRRALSEPILLKPLVDKLAASMQKVYRDSNPEIGVAIPVQLRIRADEGDLYELLGNLIDNACKWCHHRVSIHASLEQRSLRFVVEDDGPGFPEDAAKLLGRGQRADERKPGQGLGLSAVAELVTLYDGQILLHRSSLGGGGVTVTLPQ